MGKQCRSTAAQASSDFHCLQIQLFVSLALNKNNIRRKITMFYIIYASSSSLRQRR